MEKRNCLECQQRISGRTDKKFCSDNCRNYYNNGLNKLTNCTIANINNALKRNRRTLKKFAENKQATVTQLIKAGFSFDYFTHQNKQHDETTFFVFDFGYKFSGGLLVIIVSAIPSGASMG